MGSEPKKMQVVILAGGFGTRLSEETTIIPKPMVKIGEHPILWHIMKIYSAQGYNDFIICLGYKGAIIEEYFHNMNTSSEVESDSEHVTFNIKSQGWNVTLVDTGSNTMTGGRLKRVGKYIKGNAFMMSYGDGVADVNLNELLKFHKSHGKKATVTAVKPAPRFGSLNIEDDGRVDRFQEKKDHPWINGGYFVLDRSVLDYIKGDSMPFESEPLVRLAHDGELYAYRHSGFWRCMDMMSDKVALEELWANTPPWKIWKD